MQSRVSVHSNAVSVERSRTAEFRQLVQQLSRDNHKRRKLEHEASSSSSLRSDNDDSAADDSGILQPAPVPPSPFTQSALHIRRSLSGMQQLLASQQRDYLNVHRHLHSASSSMTDAERDQLEKTVATFAVDCAAKIDELKAASPEPSSPASPASPSSPSPPSSASSSSADLRHHREYIVLSLYDQLRSVTALMQWMREQRRRQQKEEADTLHPAKFRDENEYNRRLPQPQPQPQPQAQPLLDDITASASSAAAEDSSSPLALENTQLLHTLSNELDALHRAETTASDVSHLLSVFNSKVMQQSEQIDNIEAAVVNSVSYIDRGVDQLRKAASRNASFRIVMLFVILVLSCSLLFLDWYYP